MNFVAVFEGQGTLTAFRTTQATQLVMDACRILRLENVLSFFFFFFFFRFSLQKKHNTHIAPPAHLVVA